MFVKCLHFCKILPAGTFLIGSGWWVVHGQFCLKTIVEFKSNRGSCTQCSSIPFVTCVFVTPFCCQLYFESFRLSAMRFCNAKLRVHGILKILHALIKRKKRTFSKPLNILTATKRKCSATLQISLRLILIFINMLWYTSREKYILVLYVVKMAKNLK
jgi:hypothetical protein